jgi:hypothetical protein
MAGLKFIGLLYWTSKDIVDDASPETGIGGWQRQRAEASVSGPEVRLKTCGWVSEKKAAD